MSFWNSVFPLSVTFILSRQAANTAFSTTAVPDILLPYIKMTLMSSHSDVYRFSIWKKDINGTHYWQLPCVELIQAQQKQVNRERDIFFQIVSFWGDDTTICTWQHEMETRSSVLPLHVASKERGHTQQPRTFFFLPPVDVSKNSCYHSNG